MLKRAELSNTNLLKVVVLAMAAGTLASSLHADTIFSTGFENPTYTLGPLSGQDGWTTAGSVAVQNSLVLSGAQSVAVIADSAGLQAARPTPVDTSVDPLVIVHTDFLFAGNPTEWTFDALGGAFNNLGGISILPDGTLQADTTGLPTATVLQSDTVYGFDLVYDFPNDTFSAYINGGLIFGNQPFQDTSDTTQFLGLGFVSDGGGGLLLADNFSVVGAVPPGVPEPAAGLMIGVALVGLSCFAKRRQIVSRR